MRCSVCDPQLNESAERGDRRVVVGLLGDLRHQLRMQHGSIGVEHHDGRLLIVTNADDAVDFKLVEVPVATPAREHWVEVEPHRPGVKLSGNASSWRTDCHTMGAAV